jgi:hypothetical protein
MLLVSMSFIYIHAFCLLTSIFLYVFFFWFFYMLSHFSLVLNFMERFKCDTNIVCMSCFIVCICIFLCRIWKLTRACVIIVWFFPTLNKAYCIVLYCNMENVMSFKHISFHFLYFFCFSYKSKFLLCNYILLKYTSKLLTEI